MSFITGPIVFVFVLAFLVAGAIVLALATKTETAALQAWRLLLRLNSEARGQFKSYFGL